MSIYDYIGRIQSKIVPQQGMTSSVTLLESERGRFAIKYSNRSPYIDWLKREAHVLRALEVTKLPIPRCISLDTQADSASLLMTALPGEPLSALLCRGVSKEMRLDLLNQFGHTLLAIHTAMMPIELLAERHWLERILDEARINAERGYAEPDAQPVDIFAASCPSPIPEVLIHGDYTIDNVLVDAGRITGVIDWSRGDVGDRRYDLALATRPQEPESAFLEEDDFAAFYKGYSSDRLTSDENEWFFNLYAYF